MIATIRMGAVAAAVLLVLVSPAAAADGLGGIFFSGAFGAAFTIVGAAYGIGKIGASAVESMARQPEIAGQIQTAMIIAAALVEGATFFALLVCWFGNSASYLPAL